MKKHCIFWAVLFSIYFAATIWWINSAPAATQIGTDQIKNSAITNSKLANDAVTDAKFDSASGITVATATITGTATASKLVSTGNIEAAATGTFTDLDISDRVGAARADVASALTAGSADVSGLLEAGSADVAGALTAGSADVSGVSTASAFKTPPTASGAISIGPAGPAVGFAVFNSVGEVTVFMINYEEAGLGILSAGATGTSGLVQVQNIINTTKITLDGGSGDINADGTITAAGYSVGAAVGISCSAIDVAQAAVLVFVKGILTSCTGAGCTCP